MNEEGNPYYFKDRNEYLNPETEKTPINFKISNDFRTDLDEYLLKLYPDNIKKNGNVNYNKSMIQLILSILNNRCIERKYYNIDVLAIYPKGILEEERNPCSYIAIKDNYLIAKEGTVNNSLELFEYNEQDYLHQSVFLSDEEAIDLITENNFTENRIKFHDPKYFKDEVQHFQEEIQQALIINTIENSEVFSDFDLDELYIDYSFFRFKINNYLDEWNDEEFYHLKKDNHLGLGFFKEFDSLKFFCYEWIIEDNVFQLKNIFLIDEDEFIASIVNSGNEDLKAFYKSFVKSDVPEESLEKVPESEEDKLLKYEKEIHDLKEELKQKDKLIQDLEIEVKYSKIKRPEDRFKTISDMAKEEDVTEESVEMIPLDKIVKAIDEVLDNYK